jgi:hypothetical protein
MSIHCIVYKKILDISQLSCDPFETGAGEHQLTADPPAMVQAE